MELVGTTAMSTAMIMMGAITESARCKCLV
jgi:hypothetical protein